MGPDHERAPTMHRRNFLKASALAPAAVAIGTTPGLGGQATLPLGRARQSDWTSASLHPMGLRSHCRQADALAACSRARSHARSRRRRHVLSRVVLRLLPWPVRSRHRCPVFGPDDRWDVGGLVCRLVDGERPLPAHAHRVRLLRAFSEALCEACAGGRAQCEPGAGPEDQCRRQGRFARHAADHRAGGARGRQSLERRGCRATGCVPDRRQQDELARGEHAHDCHRLLFRRSRRRLAGHGAEEQHPACARHRGELLACRESSGRRCSASATAWMAACAPTRRTSTSWLARGAR